MYVALALFARLPVLADSPVRPGTIVPLDGGGGSTYGPLAYDPSGNIMSIGSDTNASNEYIYDPLGRVVTAAVQRKGLVQQQAYTYDVYGNLRLTDTSGSRLQRGVHEPTNRLSNEGPLYAAYDPSGNLTSWIPPGQGVQRDYAYDALNMMTREAARGSSGVTYV
ncbi:MAG TPA: hypothetical protein VJ840_17745, partial [Gemmatimonadaceae bacterium]|nr:hypothetical protein [Gemmatimonadaceae bacterium]